MHGAPAILTGSAHSLAHVSLWALALGLGLHVLKLGAEARAWHGIVRHTHDLHGIRFRLTLGAFVSAIGASAVLPARVGEALRVGVVRRRVPDSSAVTIAGTIVLDTSIEVAFGAAMIASFLIAGRSLGARSSTPALSELAAHPVLVAVVSCLAMTAVVVGVARREWVRALAARMAKGFSIIQSPRAFAVRVLSWKLVAWSLRLGSVYAFLLAFHIQVAPWTALAVVAAQSVAASVPLLPGNAGTQQAAIGVALAGSASAAALLGFGVGMQSATAIADLILGAAALMLVAGRDDLRGALGTMRVRRATRAR
jgi:glycosyltransferase 2 family protein